MPAKFCLTCRKLTTNGSRCETCQAKFNTEQSARRGTTKQRGLGGNYRRRAEGVVKSAEFCAICGHPPTPQDPLTADHTIPRSAGGTDSPLRAVHRSCNSRRGGIRRTK